jgi:hypothetical protein
MRNHSAEMMADIRAKLESACKAAGVILRPAHHRRAEEAAEIADRMTELIQAMRDAAAVPVRIIDGIAEKHRGNRDSDQRPDCADAQNGPFEPAARK